MNSTIGRALAMVALVVVTLPACDALFPPDNSGGSDGSDGSDTMSDDSNASAPSGGGSDSGSGGGTTAGPQGPCGWGVIPGFGDAYLCGGDGEDPDGVYPMSCEGVLEVGGACASISAEGCCDEAMDVWRCVTDPNTLENTLELESCAG